MYRILMIHELLSLSLPCRCVVEARRRPVLQLLARLVHLFPVNGHNLIMPRSLMQRFRVPSRNQPRLRKYLLRSGKLGSRVRRI
ncbi:hypothetical protein BZA77DRAFT_302853 [Pyronema omphalodes]|nr:hypothetical protein BZA77DRAFT_302853 [Pyronema omphalodes]